jgi:adenine-specific DNA-methyltransferase
MQTSLQKLQTLLRKLFRADDADLDFGIYRIINYRRAQVQAFIDEELPAIVNNILDANTEAESAHQQLETLAQQIRQTLGANALDADGNLINEMYRETPLVQQYLEAQAQLGAPQTRDQRADAVFNHLHTFFSRYYESGDFIPRRRYSQTERYAIPYNGEEVYLHWANRDQYYVKSGEQFSVYRFKSRGITVTFDLRDIDVEKDNVKGANRFFIPLSAETTYSPETDEICIPFEYRRLTDSEQQRYSGQKPQDKIIDAAAPEIMAHLTNHYNALSALEDQTEGVTTLKKHLRTYTRCNTADFFIHKDLEQFLNRELDVYIKNEVIPLSDFILTNENLGWLETAKAVYDIASRIIGFLSQIEEFQKRLWLKKKFVLSTDYCLTLDRVPEELYPEIAQKTAQREEWKHLFAIHEIDGDLVNSTYTEPLSVAFLKENPNLVLDTYHFRKDPTFKDRLLASFDDIDNQTDGVLIHGENFQALNLLTERYRESLKAIYIDPPYNTDASAILYKNNYKDSSWISLMADRLALSRKFLPDDGIICVAIDDVEVSLLRLILENLFEKELGIATILSNPQSRSRAGYFSPAHEYALFYGKLEASPGSLPKTEKQRNSYPYEDEKGRFTWDNLIRRPPGDNRSDRPRLFYPIYVRQDNTIRIPRMTWNETERAYNVLEDPNEDEVSVIPIKAGVEKRWRHRRETVAKEIAEYRVRREDNIHIEYKSRMLEEAVPKTWWGEGNYAAARYGTTLLEGMLGPKIFDFPKSVYLVSDCLRASGLNPNETVLDYFAGSGTTAHATINLNRQDSGNRKYILVEVGHHFDTALKLRVMKAIYAEKWKDAKPVSRESRLSHIIKYQRIESYEDALNNIEFTEQETSFYDKHLLHYLIGGETRESPTYLNVAKLQNPFSYQLKVVNGLQTQTQTVDLPETFNYLLGISVQTRRCLYDDDRRYLIYRGAVGGKTVVIIWRETEDWGTADWERDYRFIQENELTEGVDKVYVNTDSIVPEAESLDPLFKRLMFSQ